MADRLRPALSLLGWFARTLARLALVFVVVTFVAFLLLARLPGDLCIAQLGFNAGVPGLLEKCRHSFGLDRSLIHQYVAWLGHFVRGDLGTDPISRRPMTVMLGMRFGRTLELVVITMTLSLLIGTVAGLAMAYREGRWLDRLLSASSMVAVSIPVFVVMVFFQTVLVGRWGLFPPSGLPPWSVDPMRHLHSLVLPVTTLVLVEFPVIARVVRADAITTLQSDHVAAAKSRGLSHRAVLTRHVLRPSSFTLVTVAGLQAGELVSGLVVVERYFGVDGLGSMFFGAVTARSGFMLMTLVTIGAATWVVLNATVDLVYTWLDPRVRAARRAPAA
jgi:peptide/nickel transport system permease protein